MRGQLKLLTIVAIFTIGLLGFVLIDQICATCTAAPDATKDIGAVGSTSAILDTSPPAVAPDGGKFDKHANGELQGIGHGMLNTAIDTGKNGDVIKNPMHTATATSPPANRTATLGNQYTAIDPEKDVANAMAPNAVTKLPNSAAGVVTSAVPIEATGLVPRS